MAKDNTGKPGWDRAPRKVAAHAKLKNLPEGDQETLWLLMHPTDAETPPMTLEAVLVHLQEEHGISCALSTLSEWHSWYALGKRMEKAAERSRQATLEFASTYPDAGPEDLERFGQMIFTAESIEARDLKGFNALVRERSRRMSLELDRRKLVLLEAAAAEAKAKLDAITTKAKSKGGITPETLAAIEEAASLL